MEFSLYLNEFFIVSIAMTLALISPGPDFAMVLKQSITYGKKTSIYTSIGIGCGISVHIIYTILGVGLIISKSIVLFNIIKYLGAIYLIYLGYISLKSKGFKLKKNNEDKIEIISDKKAFLMGFLCNALNPKATLFFVSLFSVVVSINTPLYIQSIYGLYAILSAIIWFVALSLLLSQDRVRRFFNRFGKWFDRVIGVVLITLGLKIAFSK